ncbi:AraC family transcriptional regulator [Marivirga sp. S37H4]|uniref:AraC family transcriptional regulator n=1 Tax=Marivirga aurantiaca TaxID=2802615 RepID=A0A934WVR3_9BACT|nr:helix-turn-helix domain-containing protein [Marivirga aurantiaca]MBK6263826.1 AraC family transcriptional regulator [Marivirga aurantiaca]
MIHYATISHLLQAFGLPGPQHPLIWLNSFEACEMENFKQVPKFTCDCYLIFFKKITKGQILYGHSSYDHTQGTLSFFKPRQIIEFKEVKCDEKGFILAFHEDFLNNSGLFYKITKMSFFEYEVNESLHVSENEKHIFWQHFHQMEKEYNSNEDEFSKELIIAQIESILVYAKRFYKRQFLHRQPINSRFYTKFNEVLQAYYRTEQQYISGLPSVNYIAEKLHLSPKYLSDLLRHETGKSALEHIHLYLINQAKNILTSSDVTIAEIAYQLGFEHPPYFTRLFKKRVGINPNEFRAQHMN